jgi:hypothetical protein
VVTVTSSRAAVLALIAACSAEALPRPPAPPVDWASLEPRPPAAAAVATNKERNITEAYLKALSADSAPALASVLADEVHFNVAGLETTAVYGRAGVVRAHEQLFGAFRPRMWTATRVLRTDRSQAIEWTLAGRDEATGKPIGFRGVTLTATKDDGTISDLHVYFDQGIVHAQLTGEPRQLAELAPALSPTTSEERIEQGRTTDESAAVATVSRWIDDALQRDELGYLAAATDDIEVSTLQRASPMRGKKGLRDYYAAMHAAIGSLDTQLDSVVGVGRYVIAEYHIVGRQRAKYLYVPVKEPVIKLYIVDVIEMRGGKVGRIWRYENPLQIVQ